MLNRLETVFKAIDQMAAAHGKVRPKQFGGGKWDFNEEIELWKCQVKKGEINMAVKNFEFVPMNENEWSMVDAYIISRRKAIKQ